MTKSVSGQDVEDMLSSVRRLVSSELPRIRRTRLPEGPGALVLTDEQRIEPSLTGHNSPPKSLEDRIAELEAAVSESSDEWEPDGSEDQDQHRPNRIVYKPSEDERKSDRRRSLRLSEIALIETGPANDEDAEVPDDVTAATFRHDSDDDADFSREEEVRAEDVAAPAEEILSDLPYFATEEFPSEDFVTEETPLDEIEDVIPDDDMSEEADEAPIVASFEPPTEDLVSDVEVVDGTATEEDFEDALAEAVAASLPEVAAESLNEDLEVATEEIERQLDANSTEDAKEIHGDSDAAEIDKSTLQPLVASMIRAELQGELGERITRNVRKLVRQEIQRALAVRELE